MKKYKFSFLQLVVGVWLFIALFFAIVDNWTSSLNRKDTPLRKGFSIELSNGPVRLDISPKGSDEDELDTSKLISEREHHVRVEE